MAVFLEHNQIPDARQAADAKYMLPYILQTLAVGAFILWVALPLLVQYCIWVHDSFFSHSVSSALLLYSFDRLFMLMFEHIEVHTY